MTRIAGLNYEMNTRGAINKVTFDLRKIHNNDVVDVIEDLIDGMEAEAARKEGVYFPLNDVINDLEKKHGKLL